MGYSTRLILHLVSILITMKTNPTLSDCCKLASEILCNIGHRLDVTGANRFAYVLWINDVLHYSTVKAQKMGANMSSSVFSTSFAQQYGTVSAPISVEVGCLGTHIDENGDTVYDTDAVGTKQSNISIYNDNRIYTLVNKCLLVLISDLLKSQDRSLVLRGMGMLCQISYAPDNWKILQNIPQSMLQLLIDYIYCNNTTADPLHMLLNKTLQNKNTNQISLVTPGFVCLNYHIDVSDVELRDLCLETIIALCQHNSILRQKIGSYPNLLEYICHVIETYTNTGQQIGLLKACHSLLNILVKESSVREYILVNQLTLCSLSCVDEYVCDFMMHHQGIVKEDNDFI